MKKCNEEVKIVVVVKSLNLIVMLHDVLWDS
jgi:hypothetical protein